MPDHQHLSLLWHMAHTDWYAVANQIIFKPARVLDETLERLHSTWLKNITDDLTSSDMPLLETRDAA